MSTRCPWVGKLPIYIDYHDKEWGKPQFDSQKLFEKMIVLEHPRYIQQYKSKEKDLYIDKYLIAFNN